MARRLQAVVCRHNKSLAVLALALSALHLLVFRRHGRCLVKSESKNLADNDDNDLHNDGQSQHQVGSLSNMAKDESARVRQSHNDEGHASSSGQDDAVLALSDVSLVHESEGNGHTHQDNDGNHDTSTGFAEGVVLDDRVAVDKCVGGVGAADDDEDDTNQHEQLDELEEHGLDKDVALAVDGFKDSREKTDDDQDERTETKTVENHPAD